MKKWCAIILSAAVALSIPASALATDGDNGAKVESALTIDGKMDAKWAQTDKFALNDASSGVTGFYRLMWDDGNLYVLVALEGAAKFWTKEQRPLLLSLWYNGEGKTAADGSVSFVWPKLLERHDNGLHLGWFKGDKVVKAEAVTGDNVVIELKLPWEHKEGKKLEKDLKIGFGLVLKALDKVETDANGQIVINLKAEDIAKYKPSVLKLARLLAVLKQEGTIDVDVDGNFNGNVGTGNGGVNVGGNGSVNAGEGFGGVTIDVDVDLEGNAGTGAGNNNGGNGTGGSNTAGTTAVGATTGGTGTDTGSGTGNTGVDVDEVVAGISTGVIPSAMPRTGGGGASAWTD